MADGDATFLLFTQASVMIMACNKMLIFGFFPMSQKLSKVYFCKSRQACGIWRHHIKIAQVYR